MSTPHRASWTTPAAAVRRGFECDGNGWSRRLTLRHFFSFSFLFSPFSARHLYLQRHGFLPMMKPDSRLSPWQGGMREETFVAFFSAEVRATHPNLPHRRYNIVMFMSMYCMYIYKYKYIYIYNINNARGGRSRRAPGSLSRKTSSTPRWPLSWRARLTLTLTLIGLFHGEPG